MSFPLSLFLYIYYAFLIFWAIFSLVALYHMVKFSFINFTSFFTIVLYLGISAVLLKISFLFIGTIDWGINLAIFQNMFNQPHF